MSELREVKMFDHRAFCDDCGWSTKAPSGNLFFVHILCCPVCGNHKPISGCDGKWSVMCVAWVSTSIWYKPSTWFSGYWLTRDKYAEIRRRLINEQS